MQCSPDFHKTCAVYWPEYNVVFTFMHQKDLELGNYFDSDEIASAIKVREVTKNLRDQPLFAR